MWGMKQPRGSAGGDFLFFIFFLIVLGVVWALTGGPKRDISHAGPFLNLPYPLGNGAGYSIPSVPVPTQQQIEQAGGGGASSQKPETLVDIIARLRLGIGGSSGSSSYADSVNLSNGDTSATDPSKEYVVIKFDSDMKGKVPVSNWRIESAITTNGTTLGPAVALPFSGDLNQEGTVFAEAGTTLYVVTGRSPTGYSFRENICSGYFGNRQSFVPTLFQWCPRGKDELLVAAQKGFQPSDACISYVEGLRTCQLVSTGFPLTVDDQCQSFITTTLTYNGCVYAHKTDKNFYKNTWYLYLDRSQELWKSKNDQIRLLDDSGEVVATMSY